MIEVLLTLVVALLVELLLDASQAVVRWLVVQAAGRVSGEQRARYQEEWLAELESSSSRTERILAAVRIYLASAKICAAEASDSGTASDVEEMITAAVVPRVKHAPERTRSRPESVRDIWDYAFTIGEPSRLSRNTIARLSRGVVVDRTSVDAKNKSSEESHIYPANVEDVARLVDRRPSTVRRWLREGTLAGTKSARGKWFVALRGEPRHRYPDSEPANCETEPPELHSDTGH